MTRTSTRIHAPLAALVAALAAMLVVVAPAGAVEQSGRDSVGFGVSPLIVDVERPPGTSSTHRLTITNTDTSAVKYTFSKEDFSGDQDDPGATPVLLGGKFESPISGYDWITLPSPITVPAGSSRTVDVKVTAPSGATGPHYTAVMVTGEERSAGRIIAKSRIGVLFLMNAGGAPPPELVITEITEVGPGRTVTQFINTGGNATEKVESSLESDPVGPGGKKDSAPGVCTQVVLPGAAGECEYDTSELGGNSAFGLVKPSVNLVGEDAEGEGTSARSELPTTWEGTWSSLLLVLVGLGLFVLYFLFLRRRRKQEAEEASTGMAWAGPSDG